MGADLEKLCTGAAGCTACAAEPLHCETLKPSFVSHRNRLRVAVARVKHGPVTLTDPKTLKRRRVKAIDIELWSINRWLRWTGFRLFVTIDIEGIQAKRLDDLKPTKIGIGFYGWRGLF